MSGFNLRAEIAVVHKIADLSLEITTPNDRSEDVIDGNKQEAVVVVVVIRHYKPLIAGVGCQQVVCAAGKVVNLANGAVGGIVGIEVIAGIIVAATLSQGGIRQGAALRDRKSTRLNSSHSQI